MLHHGRLHLSQYYLIEALAAFASALFQQGIYFWAIARFGFTETENLLLGATQGLAYVITASVGGRASDRWGYDRVIQLSLAGMAIATITLAGSTWHYAPFLAGGLYAALIGPFWPALEATVVHARTKLTPSRRLGIYNVNWSLAGALGFFSCGFLVAGHPMAIVWFPGVLMLVQLTNYLFRARPVPCGEADEIHEAHAQALPDVAVRRRFMHLHWMSNAMAYFMMSGFAALIPSLGPKLGLTQSSVIWLTCAYLFARAASFVVCMLWDGWHYRARWSHAALWAAPAALLFMLHAAQPAVVLAACVVFGLVIGISYSGSLYYSMNYGANKGEHGGKHEAILGCGILLGPLAGAGGAAWHGAEGASWTITVAAVVVTIAGVAVVAAANRTRGAQPP